LDSPEDRRHERQAPPRSVTTLVTPNGLTVPCKLLDVSLSGAAVLTNARPPLGALVTVGRTPARVVRHRDDGIAVEFTRLQHPDFINENLSPK
jgi:hypothetical protein